MLQTHFTPIFRQLIQFTMVFVNIQVGLRPYYQIQTKVSHENKTLLGAEPGNALPYQPGSNTAFTQSIKGIVIDAESKSHCGMPQ